jgi:hypothetical protein
MSSAWPQEDDGLHWPPVGQMPASPAPRDTGGVTRGYPPYRPEDAGDGGYSPYWPDDGGAARRPPAAPVTSWDLPAIREPAGGVPREQEDRPRSGGYRGDADGTGYQPERPGWLGQPGYRGSARPGYGAAGYQNPDRTAAASQPAGYGNGRDGSYRGADDHPGLRGDPGTHNPAYRSARGLVPGYGNGYHDGWHPPGNGSSRPLLREATAGRDRPSVFPGPAAPPRGRRGRHSGYAPAAAPGNRQAGYRDAGTGYGVNDGYGYQDANGATVSLRLPQNAMPGYPRTRPAADGYDCGQLSIQRLPAGDLAAGAALTAGEFIPSGGFPAGGPPFAGQEPGGGGGQVLDDVPAGSSLADELASGEFPTSQFIAGGPGAGEPGAIGTAATSVLDRPAPAGPRAPGRRGARGGRGEATVIQRPPSAPAAGDRGSRTGGWATTTTAWFQAVRDGGRPPGKRRGRSGDRRLWIALGGLAVIAVASAMAIVTLVLPSGPGGPAHTLATPSRIGTYLRRPALERQMNIDQLRSDFISMSSGHTSHVVEAVYEAGTSGSAKPPQILMFIGGNVAYASPSASLDGFLQRFQGAAATSPGSLGGKAACVNASAAQPGSPGNMAICTWFDNDTVGELISPTMNAAALAQTMRSVRPQLELVARKKS